MSFTLTDDEKKQLKTHRACAHGRNVFSLCPMCGNPEWMMCQTNDPDEIEAHVGSNPCVRCQEIHQRAPELTDWVLDVLNWRYRTTKKP